MAEQALEGLDLRRYAYRAEARQALLAYGQMPRGATSMAHAAVGRPGEN
jgi:hypothetical protein